MDISTIPNPTFLVNENGRLSLLLPSFEGKPENPSLVEDGSRTLKFIRSPEKECLLTEVAEEAIEALKKAKKILILELNLAKSIDFMEHFLESAEKDEAPSHENIDDLIEMSYEISFG